MALSFVASAGTRAAGSYYFNRTAPLKGFLVQQGLDMAVCGLMSYVIKRDIDNKRQTDNLYVYIFQLVVYRASIACIAVMAADAVTRRYIPFTTALVINGLVPFAVILANVIYEKVWGLQPEKNIVKMYW